MHQPLKPIPKFASEAEERAFWEKHDSASHVDWTKAGVILKNIPNPTPLISGKRRKTSMMRGLLPETGREYLVAGVSERI